MPCKVHRAGTDLHKIVKILQIGGIGNKKVDQVRQEQTKSGYADVYWAFQDHAQAGPGGTGIQSVRREVFGCILKIHTDRVCSSGLFALPPLNRDALLLF